MLLMSFSVYSNNLAEPCLGCHAAIDNSIPNIRGIDYNYFVSSFTDYKNDKREHYLMRIIAKGYSKKQIESMAKYFESIDEN